VANGSIINWNERATFLENSSGTAACPPTAPAITSNTPLTLILLSNTAPLDVSAVNGPAT